MEDRRPPVAWCAVCAAPRRPDRACGNRWCARPNRAFSVVYAAGAYRSALRRAILSYKFRSERRWAEPLARLLAAHVDGHPTWYEELDLVVGVPSWTGVGARRGWDPVGEILGHLGRRLGPGWPVVPAAIVKTAETPAMHDSTWARRQVIAAGPLRRALRVPDPAAVAGARILVVDDVLTDGATLQVVASALRRAGAAEVVGLVVARQTWRRRPDRPGGRPRSGGSPRPGRRSP